MHAFTRYGLCVAFLLAVACSKREPADTVDARSMAESGGETTAVNQLETNAAEVVENLREVPVGEFDAFTRRLERMDSLKRNAGETLLTGETLVFDYDQRFVRMDRDVKVSDDQGVLKTQSLVGRFSASNDVESIEAKGGVDLVSSNRTATAEEAIYHVRTGYVQMKGRASASDGGNRLAGEQIELWLKGERKMVCEPNALLEVKGVSGLQLEGVPAGGENDTEVRADQVVYDESKHLAELAGNVRVRDSRAAMNCDQVRIFLKDDNEIDWIEASGGVIIQTKERKALAEKATYHADEGKFTLLGEPKVRQGLNVMTGDRIIFWHETRRMICEPNARVLLYLDEDTKAKFLNDLNE